MKGIKEAAKKYSESKGIYTEHGRKTANMGFRAGAEWVLEEVKRICKDESLTDGEVVDEILAEE